MTQRLLNGCTLVGLSVWNGLRAQGRNRARRELLALESTRTGEQAGEIRAALTWMAEQEAQDARALADRMQKRDPRFAAELRAAADRHEVGAAAPTPAFAG